MNMQKLGLEVINWLADSANPYVGGRHLPEWNDAPIAFLKLSFMDAVRMKQRTVYYDPDLSERWRVRAVLLYRKYKLRKMRGE